MSEKDDQATELDPRAITEDQFGKMGELGKDVRSFIVRRGRELGLPLDKTGTAVLLLLVHTAEPSWPGPALRAQLGQMLDVGFELREMGSLEAIFGPALPLNQPDPRAEKPASETIECEQCGTVFTPLRCPAPDCQAEQTGAVVSTNRDSLQ